MKDIFQKHSFVFLTYGGDRLKTNWKQNNQILVILFVKLVTSAAMHYCGSIWVHTNGFKIQHETRLIICQICQDSQ